MPVLVYPGAEVCAGDVRGWHTFRTYSIIGNLLIYLFTGLIFINHPASAAMHMQGNGKVKSMAEGGGHRRCK